MAAHTAGLLLSGGLTAALADEGRGKLLYETHCIACHSTQMHWRAKKQAQDWDSLLAQVAHWQSEARLDWSQADIEAVAHHLNDTIYRHPLPQRRAGFGPARVAIVR